MIRYLQLVVYLILLIVCQGCGNGAVSGGTEGQLHSDGNPLGDFRITVYQTAGGSLEELGFASTKNDGAFKLIQKNSKDNLWLPNGEYVFTVESIGSDVVVPDIYSKPETTLLKVNWSNDGSLNLNIPGLKEPS